MNFNRFCPFRSGLRLGMVVLLWFPAALAISAQPVVVPEFLGARVFGGGGSIGGQATADFNSDGKLDVIISDFTNNNLRLFLNKGNGDFVVPPVLVPGFIAPLSIAAGDFNADGKTDIAVVADDVVGSAGGVVVALGNGNGTFGARTPYSIGITPQVVLADDFNGDSKLDFVVFESFDSTLKVYFGDGMGAHTLSATIPSMRALYATGDFNGDGKPEIIARRSTATPLTMLANNGDGTFAAPASIATGGMSSPQTVVAGRFNGDSNLDLYATSTFSPNNMIPLFGNGNNTFTAGTLATHNSPLGLSAASDFNRDDKTDLVITNDSGRTLVFRGNGDGTFLTPVSYGSGGARPVVADFNGDGWTDIYSIVYTNTGGVGNFAILLNKRNGSFLVAPDYPFGSAVRDMTTGNLNSDQFRDLVSLTSFSVGAGQLLYSFGAASGTFGTTTARSLAIVPQSLVMDDFNGDMINDVVVGGFGDSGNVQNFAFLAGTGTGLAAPVHSQIGAGINDLHAVDLNGDGKKDLAVVASSDFLTALGNGNGTFATPVSYAANGLLRRLAAGDFNNDGNTDFAAIKTQTSEVVLLINNGSGGFTFGTSLSSAVFQMGLGTADMNGDSNTDIVVATDASGVYVFKGNGNGTFQAPSIFPAPARFLDGVAIADFNQDGKPDVASNSFVSGAVVFVNDGTGGLVEVRTWGATKFPLTVWVDDLNADQKPDILIGGYEPGNITVLLNGRNPLSSRSPFDFDGDGKTDIGIFRPSVAEWWIQKSGDGNILAAQFGATTDKIVPADYTGDGKTDIAVWRPASGEWYVLRSEDFSFFAFPFGTNGDVPVPSDYDSDGKADAAVFRGSNATWYIFRSTGGTTIETFGADGDIPVPADYDGDGKADIAIFRPSLGQWWINRSTAGLIAATFGNGADKPVQGDYTGDGKSDVALWRPSTGEWFVLRSEDSSFFAFGFGTTGDVPAPGDYDGDGRHDATVFRPSSATWYSQRTTAGTLIQQFGSTGDRPVPNAYVP